MFNYSWPLTRLQRIQHRCNMKVDLKQTNKQNRIYSPSLKALYWPPVAHRIQFNPIVHTFKSLNNLSPTISLASFQCASYQLTPSDPPLSLVFVFQATLSNWRHFHPLILVYGAIFLPGLVAFPPLPLSENLLKVTSFLISWYVSISFGSCLSSSIMFLCFSLLPNALYHFGQKTLYKCP